MKVKIEGMFKVRFMTTPPQLLNIKKNLFIYIHREAFHPKIPYKFYNDELIKSFLQKYARKI